MDAWNERSLRLGELLARAGLGDGKAFAELYRLTSAPLLGVVLRIQTDRSVAEEVLQEVFVNVWRHAGSFSAAQSQPMTWLTRIARNRAIDSLRRAQAQPQTVANDGAAHEDWADAAEAPRSLLDREADPSPGALELLERAADARSLQSCMSELPAAQRQSVALAFYDGMSHAEVAEHLQLPLGTVKSWVRRALQVLRSCLDRAVQRESDAHAAARK